MTMVLLMFSTVVAAFFAGTTPHFGNIAASDRTGPVLLADWSNLLLLVQTAIFSTAFQFAVPGMAHISKNKKTMLSIFSSAVTFIYVSALVLSAVLSSYFGPQHMQESSNLNWINYHGGTCDPSWTSAECESGRAWWAKAISFYVLFFAAIDGLAVYPLLAISLGDILMGAVYEDKVHEAAKNWMIRGGFRLLASLPQAIAAILFRNIGVM